MTSWTWVWNSQAPPPGNSQIRTDSRDWINALQVNMASSSNDGVDHTSDLAALKVGDWIQVQHALDGSRYVTFELTLLPVNMGTYFQFAVAYNTGGGALPNSGTQCLVSLRYMPVSSQSPGEKAYSGYSTAIIMGTPAGGMMPWSNLSPADKLNWEAAGKGAQTV